MKEKIQLLLAEILEKMGISDAGISVEIPENSKHGDYTTNIAMLLTGRLKAPPVKIAQEIADHIIEYQKKSVGSDLAWLEKVEIAPPGFINLWLSSAHFGSQLGKVLEEKDHYGSGTNQPELSINVPSNHQKKPSVSGQVIEAGTLTKKTSKKQQKITSKKESLPRDAEKEGKKQDSASFGKKIMVEFAHPNTHKAFHIGHLRNITTGEAIVRLLEAVGYEVTRVNYQGDVGMHIAKCLYGILQGSSLQEMRKASIEKRVEFLGKAYAAGSKAFEEDESAKKAIGQINKQIYAKDPAIYPLYQETRQWSLDYFEHIYKRVGSHFDRLYFESEVYEEGKRVVEEGLQTGIFEKSDGAVIFRGKSYGLDTRVFLTGEGNTTYEGKELGLSKLETTEFGELAHIIHVVGPEQASFFTVTFKAEELLGIVKPDQQHHLVYGWVKLKQGKMSSRSGNVVLGEWLLDEAKKSIYTIVDKSTSDEIAEACALAAVKYAFLKVGTNQEIAFDLKESVNFEGDSGPYLLYTYARCKSVLRKAEWIPGQARDDEMNPEERNIARRISQFTEVVSDAAVRFAPNALCTYLFHLAQEFNVFYAKHEILKEPRRLALTAATAQVLKNGLYLLGISTVERM